MSLKFYYIFKCNLGAKHQTTRCYESITPNWSEVCRDIENLVLGRSGSNCSAIKTTEEKMMQRGRTACKQKLMAKVIANIKSSDVALARVGSASECSERANLLPWLENKCELVDGDVLLLFRVPIEYQPVRLSNDLLISDSQHMKALFLKKAGGQRWSQTTVSLGSFYDANSDSVPLHLQSLVRKRSEKCLETHFSVHSADTAPKKQPDSLKDLFKQPLLENNRNSNMPLVLSGASETARIEALINGRAGADASQNDMRDEDKAGQGAKKRINSHGIEEETKSAKRRTGDLLEVPEPSFDSALFWTGRQRQPGDAPLDASEMGEPPRLYVCHRCGVPGHWLRDCPTKSDTRFDGAKILTTNGIPKQHLKRVQINEFDFTKNTTLYRDQEGNFFVKKSAAL